MRSEAQLLIKAVGGESDSFQICVSNLEDTTVLALKHQLEERNPTAYPVAAQRLIFKGQILKNDKKLGEYQISNGCAIHLTVNRSVLDRAPNSSTVLRSYLEEIKASGESVSALQTLQKVCENIILHPNEEKFRKLRLSNVTLQAKLLNVPRAMDCLFWLGFQQGILEDHLTLVPTAEKWNQLNEGKRVIDEVLGTVRSSTASASNPLLQMASQLNPMIAQAFQNPHMLNQSLQMLQQNPTLMNQMSQLMQNSVSQPPGNSVTSNTSDNTQKEELKYDENEIALAIAKSLEEKD
uniref:Ubiquitin family protein putative n=1 Tax=Albugo laibachii Nc14 TaxID=890382 RepID=F0WHH1_9STRA|nr:ubiquitin family protein putative [Albugo laibachii Nc14]|eukprot:CCA20690.1 ubiquitin family protein putative [Albugo laibachii Nc14]